MLGFDLERTPPSDEAVTAERRMLADQITQRHRRQQIAAAFLPLATATTVALLFAATGTAWLSLVATGLLWGTLGAAGKQTGESRRQLAELSPVAGSSECPNIACSCLALEACRRYVGAVEEMGRSLTVAESRLVIRAAADAERRGRALQESRLHQAAGRLLSPEESLRGTPEQPRQMA